MLKIKYIPKRYDDSSEPWLVFGAPNIKITAQYLKKISNKKGLVIYPTFTENQRPCL